MATIFSSDFDADTIGATPSGWTNQTGTVWAAQTAPAGMSGRVAQAVQDNVVDSYLYRTFTRQTTDINGTTFKLKSGPSVAGSRRWGIVGFTDGGVGAADILAIGIIGGNITTAHNGTVITAAAVSTVYTFVIENVNFTTDKFDVRINGTLYDNAGAHFSMAAGASGIDTIRVSRFSGTLDASPNINLDDVTVANSVSTAPDTPTLAAAGTPVNRFGQVDLVATDAGTGVAPTSYKVYRSADNSTFTEITSTSVTQADGGTTSTIRDRRPQRGTQLIALGATGYYKVKATNAGGDSAFSNTITVTDIEPDVATFKTTRFAKLRTLLDAQTGDYFPSDASEPYTGYWLSAMAYAYLDEGLSADLTAATTIWDYLKTLETAEHLTYYGHDTTHIYRDGHMRTVILSMLAGKILRAAGEGTLSAAILAKADVWAKAAIDKLARTSITRRAWVTNQPVWSSGVARAVGDLVVPTVSNGFAYVCTTAGTSGGTQPTWPLTDNATVADGGAAWTLKAVTGGVFNDTYTFSGATYTGSGSNSVDANQNLECVVAYALLMAESTSSFYTAGAYRTAAQTILDDNLNLSLLYQVNDGKIPVGDPSSAYDTNYGSYAMQLAALTASLLGTGYHPSLSRYINKGLDWLESSTYSTEPLAQVQWTGPTFTDISMIARRIACYSLIGRAVPTALVDLIYTGAFQDPATDKWGDYAEYGVTTPETDQVQARQFEADAFFYGAQVSQTLVPTGIASGETVGSPTLTPPLQPFTVQPTGIASTEAVGTPTMDVTPGAVTDLEGFVLDGLDLNTTGIYRLEEFVLGPPPKRYEWIGNNDIDGEALLRDPSQGNRPFTLKVRLMADDRDEAQAAHDAIVQKFEKAEKTEGGIVAVWTPVDSTSSYDVHVLTGETTDFPITVESGYFVNKPLITFQGVMDTALEKEERAFGPVTASTPLVELELPNVRGQLPAKATITVTDAATQTRRHVTWGLEQQHYDPAAPSELTLTADDMTGGTLTTRSGAYDPDAGSSVRRITALSTEVWAVVCSVTGAHVGIFRVVARVYATANVSVRLTWRAGDTPYVTYNPVPLVDGWNEIDLGAITLPEATLGAQTWDGRIEALATETGEPIDVNYVNLIPAGEGYGRVGAGVAAGASTLAGFDLFADTVALGSHTADVGGAWVTSGDADDWTCEAAGRIARTTTTAGVSNERLGILGSLAATDVVAQLTLGADAPTASSPTWQGGLILRYVDVSNYLWAFLRVLLLASSGASVVMYLRKRVGGIDEVIASTFIDTYPVAMFGGGFPDRTIEAAVYGTGLARLQFLVDGVAVKTIEATDADLTTGGVLASGGVGVQDIGRDFGTFSRHMSAFSVGTPPPEPVVIHPTRRLLFRHDGTLRENAGGTAYGEMSTRGGPAYVPCAGDDDLTSRIVVAARRADIEASTADDVTDATTVSATLRERFLWPA